MQFEVKVLEIQAGHVAQLNVLEVLPRGLDRVEIRGIRRQLLNAHPTAFGTRQELLDCRAAMYRRPVPDRQKPGAKVSNHMLEELDNVEPIERLLAYEDGDSTGRSDAPHNREMIAGLPHPEDGRVSLWGVRPDSPRQEVETRFIHENQGPALIMGLGLKARPDIDAPSLDLLLVPLSRACDWHLRRPVEFLQEPRDMAFVIANPKLLFDHLADSSTGPHLADEAVGLRAVGEKIGNQSDLFRFKLRWTSRNGLCEQSERSFAIHPTHPSCASGKPA
jgi:hypothetical protein